MMNSETRHCPACKLNKFKPLGEKNNFQMLYCKNCSSLYSSYLPVGEEAEPYDEYYTERNLKVPDFIVKILEETVEEFNDFFNEGKLLDIGFGAATLLQVAEKKGWKVHGVEVSKPAVENAQKYGLDVFYGDLNEARYPDNYFDVVTAVEILEHCPEPEILLDEVIRILRPGGLFWATTPSASGLSYKLNGLDWTTIYPPEHLQLFSKKGTKLMLKKAGFRQFKIKTYGFNPFEVINKYRGYFKKSKDDNSFDRVKTAYALNENLTRSPFKKKIKKALNETLSVMSMGDSLRIKAIK